MIRLLSTKLLLPQEVEAFAALGFQVESLPLIRVQLSETIEAFPQADLHQWECIGGTAETSGS